MAIESNPLPSALKRRAEDLFADESPLKKMTLHVGAFYSTLAEKESARLSEEVSLFHAQNYEAALRSFKPGALLGSGVYGRVHASELSNRIVIKCASPHKRATPQKNHCARTAEREAFLHRFFIDAQVPHIPVLVDNFCDPGKRYATVMQNVGADLYSIYIQTGRKATLDELESIGKKHLEALERIHRLNYVHLDLKPDNSALQHLLDFGLAEQVPVEQLLRSEYVKGPDLYRPPELFMANSYGVKADIWGLGCILFVLYTGTEFSGISDDPTNERESTLKALNTFVQRLELDEVPQKMLQSSSIQKHISRQAPDGSFVLDEVELAPIPSLREALIAARGEDEPAERLALFIDLVESMLTFDPNERISASNALDHRFFSSDISFKIEVIGEKKGAVAIRNDDTFLDTIQLEHCRPNTCIHVPNLDGKYHLDFLNQIDLEKGIQTVEVALQNRGLLQIDTTSAKAQFIEQDKIVPQPPQKPNSHRNLFGKK